MKRVPLFVVAGALLLAITAGVALADTLACPVFGQCTGTDSDDTIFGTNGGDDIRGEGGGDVIFAQDGGDTVSGGSGRDDIRGGNGDDVLSGSKSPDKIAGDRGSDEMYGGADNDTIYAADGEADYIDCGEGTDDKAFVDQLDTQVFNCEHVETLTIDPPS
jgi:Ca2+-binding RTX toxin-like protein